MVGFIYRMGKLEQAAFYLKQAAEMQDDAEFLAHLGEVLWQQGKHDEGQVSLATGIKATCQ